MLNGCLEDIIRKRRSIRRYKDRLPPEEWIKKILDSTLWAPSPSNIQPVRYIRIDSKRIKENLRRNMVEGKKRVLRKWKESGTSKRLKNWIDVYYDRYSNFMFDAPVIFAVGLTKERKGFYGKIREIGVESDYDQDLGHYISLGISLSHFILEAQKLGLGTCILTTPMVFLKDLNRILEIDDIDIICFVTLGFPDESPEPPERLSVSDIYIRI